MHYTQEYHYTAVAEVSKESFCSVQSLDLLYVGAPPSIGIILCLCADCDSSVLGIGSCAFGSSCIGTSLLVPAVWGPQIK